MRFGKSRLRNYWKRVFQIAAVASVAAFAWTAPATVPEQPMRNIAASATPHTVRDPYQLPPDKLAQALALSYIRPTLHFGAEFWELAVLILLLGTGTAAKLGRQIEFWTLRRWLQAAIYSAILITLLFLVVDLPTDAIGHVFSRHYRISVENWPDWLLDQAKTLALTLLLSVPALTLADGLLRWSWSRGQAWFWFAVAAVPVALVGAFLLPSLIEPLFFTFEPLAQSHPALVAELEKVVARTGTGIPHERMFLMKASEKSNGLNAYVTGIGSSKRIVVWDTTADRMPQDEILFTFAHESGHYVLNHISKGLAAGSLGLFLLFWLVARLAELLIQRFGPAWRTEAVTSLPVLAVLLLAFAILQFFAEPIENTASRYIEHQADVYGQEAIHGLVADPQKTAVAAFNDLGAAYLDDPNPHPFVEFWIDDHPSTQRRARFAARYNPWVAGERPQFFAK